MKNKNTSTIVAGIAIIAFVVGGFYFMSRGNSQSGGTTGDPMHSGGSDSSGSYGDLIGKAVPAFSLRDRNGTEYSNESLKGKKAVLFFNEGIMCYPACWNQMVSLATDPRFTGPDTVAFSVVIDQPSSWQSAVQKMPELGKATLLFDTDKSVSRKFGMLAVPSSMHYGSFPGHSFVLVDKQGIVRYTFDDPNMAIDNDKVATELAKLK